MSISRFFLGRSTTIEFLCIAWILGTQAAPLFGQDSLFDSVALRDRTHPTFFVHLDVNHPDRSYRDGDQLAVQVTCEADAYIYVFYEQADGRIVRIFPTRENQSCIIPRGVTTTIPSKDQLFRWNVAPPFGKERIAVFASKTKLHDPTLEFDTAHRGPFAPVARQEVQPFLDRIVGVNRASMFLQKNRGRRISLESSLPPINTTSSGPIEPAESSPSISDEVAFDMVVLQTNPDQQDSVNDSIPSTPLTQPFSTQMPSTDSTPTPMSIADSQITPPRSRRVGLFIGVSNHLYNDLCVEAQMPSLNLMSAHKDAISYSRFFTDYGHLDDGQTLINETATRESIRSAICQWLPQATRPGDEVVICFSGHGSHYSSDSQGEPDQLDEYLIPSDFVAAPVLIRIIDLIREQKLTERHRPLVELLREMVESNLAESQIDRFLAERTGITDDQLATWIQALDDRKVLLILDCCHAGGFASNEKSVALHPGKLPIFDFMQSENRRLKDIHQQGTAVLASCRAAEFSADGLENGRMTQTLLQVAVAAPGPILVDDAFDSMLAMFEYEQRIHPQLNIQRPVLYNQLHSPFFLRTR